MRPPASGSRGRPIALVLAAATSAAVAAGAPACASGRGRGRAPRGDRDMLTQEQVLATRFTNLYDAIASVRANWLRPRGPDSFSTPTPVWVYYDGARLGGVETLRGIAPMAVTYVRYFDGLAASARWGVGHGQGVILVSTYPR